MSEVKKILCTIFADLYKDQEERQEKGFERKWEYITLYHEKYYRNFVWGITFNRRADMSLLNFLLEEVLHKIPEEDNLRYDALALLFEFEKERNWCTESFYWMDLKICEVES